MKLTLMSYNIHKGFNQFNTQFVLHQIKKMIQETHADVVLLQEVVGENREHEQKLKTWPKQSQFEFLADQAWPHYAYGKNAVFSKANHGNAILSKFPIIKYENISLTNYKYEQRGLLHCELNLVPIQKTAHFFNVHLDLLHGNRMKQLKKIVDRAQSHVPKNTPFVLAGDFNDWSEALTPHFFKFIEVEECFQRTHGTHAKSFPSFLPLLSLDRVYFRNMSVQSSRVFSHSPWSQLSDHLPLLVEFEIE